MSRDRAKQCDQPVESAAIVLARAMQVTRLTPPHKVRCSESSCAGCWVPMCSAAHSSSTFVDEASRWVAADNRGVMCILHWRLGGPRQLSQASPIWMLRIAEPAAADWLLCHHRIVVSRLTDRGSPIAAHRKCCSHHLLLGFEF